MNSPMNPALINRNNSSLTKPLPARNLLFLGTSSPIKEEDDAGYAYLLKEYKGNCNVYIKYDPIETLVGLVGYCKSRNITGVFTNQISILTKLVSLYGALPTRRKLSLDSYLGSYFIHEGIEIIIIDRLKKLKTVDYAPMLMRRFWTKLTDPDSWGIVPEFKWTLITPANYNECYHALESADLIVQDIETVQEDLRITMSGYCSVILSPDSPCGYYLHSYVLPIKTMDDVYRMRSLNKLPPPKILQNGKYDHAYYFRYSAPSTNWLWDTINMMHSWYSELPKDLGFQNAFFVRKGMYWKDLAESADAMDGYRYNALDTYGTANVAIAWFLQAPDWAKKNYLRKFQVNFPSHMCEMRGIKRDMEILTKSNLELTTFLKKEQNKLDTMLGFMHPTEVHKCQSINISSPKQMKQMLISLGLAPSSIDSTDEKSLKKYQLANPLYVPVLNSVLNLRGVRKLLSTYLTPGKELNGRILYSINPHGTETGRNASTESAFWCGLQVQNIPSGPEVKHTLISDDDFYIAECDLEQAESRDTGYVSGETKLIYNVECGKDFHSLNLCAFFGYKYDDVYDDAKGKTKNKPLRDIAKRVNHGANYLMGPAVLVDTMGIPAIHTAQRLLRLPGNWSPLDVAKYLLSKFHETYPKLESVFYTGVVNEVENTKMLRSTAVHYNSDISKHNQLLKEHGAWTRYCFGHPAKNKMDKNAYVAHVPQSLNAMTVDLAFMDVFFNIAMNPKYAPHFKLLAQIHDSILFQYRKGHEYLVEMVRKKMEIPITITGYDGVIRSFIVPAAAKEGKKDADGNLIRARYWSETE